MDALDGTGATSLRRAGMTRSPPPPSPPKPARFSGLVIRDAPRRRRQVLFPAGTATAASLRTAAQVRHLQSAVRSALSTPTTGSRAESSWQLAPGVRRPPTVSPLCCWRRASTGGRGALEAPRDLADNRPRQFSSIMSQALTDDPAAPMDFVGLAGGRRRQDGAASLMRRIYY